MKTIGKKRLEQQAYKLITQTGNTISQMYIQEQSFAESLAKAIANLAENYR
jgi:tRNA pseudouridine-54 N-methylase